jgi:hypothetical protein
MNPASSCIISHHTIGINLLGHVDRHSVIMGNATRLSCRLFATFNPIRLAWLTRYQFSETRFARIKTLYLLRCSDSQIQTAAVYQSTTSYRFAQEKSAIRRQD